MLQTWYSVVVAKLRYKYIIVELSSPKKSLFRHHNIYQVIGFDLVIVITLNVSV